MLQKKEIPVQKIWAAFQYTTTILQGATSFMQHMLNAVQETKAAIKCYAANLQNVQFTVFCIPIGDYPIRYLVKSNLSLLLLPSTPV